MTESVEVFVKAEEGAQLPNYTTSEAAGADVRAHLSEPLILKPSCSCMVSTGLSMEIPLGYEIQVRPRSGLAAKHGLTVLNTPGTIDSDYRGDVKVILINHSDRDFCVEPGMRIAQLVLCPVIQAAFVHKSALASSERGAGGIGHTGVQ